MRLLKIRPLLICAALVSCVRAADDAPAWLREFSTTHLPAYESKVPAAVLLNEENVAVDDSGRVTTTDRKAIRILTTVRRAARRRWPTRCIS